MAENRRRGRGSHGGEPPKDDGPHDGEQPQGPGNPDADPVRIHREYIERRTGGGPPPTPERYRKALGAVALFARLGPQTANRPNRGAGARPPKAGGRRRAGRPLN